MAFMVVASGLAVLDQARPEPAAAAESSGVAPGGAANNSGAFTSQVPIEVPKFHGIEPALGLVYHSSSPDGLVGVGWQLSGAESFIERVSPGRGAPTYTASDVFLVDGEEAVASTALGGEYVTKRQSFVRIVHDEVNDVVTVWQKNGVRTVYGAKHTVTAGTFRYLRSKVIDTYGNTVNYTYTCDPGNYCYVSTIAYTGTTITLHRETRSDPVQFAAGGSPATINYRIKTIDIVTGGGRARAYKLSYGTSGPTSRSLLTKVQMFGKDATLDASGTVTGGSALPAVTMGYQGDANPSSFSVSKVARSLGGGTTQTLTNWCRGTSGYFGPADFNADGRDDFWCHNNDTGKTQVGIADAWGVSATFEATWCTAQLVYAPQYGLGDFNADGYQDFWCHDPNNEKIAISDGDGTFTVVPQPSGWCSDASWKVGIGEFNGDGRSDLWCHNQSNGTTYLALASGTNSFTAPPAMTGWCSGAASDFDVADFNGDGRTDLWCHNRTNGDTWVAQSKGDGSFATFAKSGTWCIAGPPYGFGTADYNGDSKADFFCHGMGDGKTWLATSNGNGNFTTYPLSMTWCGGGASLSFGMNSDFNGDGRDDAWCHDSNNGNTWVAFAKGLSGFQSFTMSFAECNFGPVLFGVGDFNGDGKSDFYCHDSATSGDTWVALAGSVNGRTDLLTSQTTGLGGTTTIAYKPATAYANYWLTPGLPMVASSVSANDGRGTVSTTSYSYSGAKYDPVERRSLGFSTVVAKDATGASSTTTFKQNAGFPVGRATQVDRKTSGGTLLERDQYTYSEGISGGVYTSLLSSRTHSMCSGATCQSTKVEYAYGSYGNINVVKDYGDTAVGGDERTVGTTYTLNTTAYIVDTPLQTNTYSGIGTAGTVGKQVKYTYNAAGDVTSTSDWLNTTNTWVTTKATYDAYGNLATTRNPLDAAAAKNTVSYTYDSTYHLFPTKVCDALAHCTQQGWDTVLQVPHSSTDPNSKITSWTYDSLGRMTKEERPDGSSTAHGWANLGNAGTQYQQDTVSDGTANGIWTQTYFDGLGRTWKQVGEPDIISLIDYNTQGQVEQVTHPYRSGGVAKWTSFAYDALGRLVTTTNPDGSKRQNSYTIGYNVNDSDFATPKYRVTECNETGTCNATSFNGHGQPLVTSDITPGWTAEYRSRSTYDVWGRLIKVTDNVGANTTFAYDSLDRRTAVADPDTGYWTYGYDDNSRLKWQKDARGQQIDNTYDAVGRLKTEKVGTTTLATYNYDEAGHGAGVVQLTSVTDQSGSTSWTYDSMGRPTTVVKTVAGTAYTVSQTFDSAGRRKSLTYPGGEVVNYTYNAEGCLTGVGGYVTAATCTAAGQLATRTFGNGVTQTMSYDANRLWLTGDNTKNSGGGVLQNETYGHNSAGQVTSKTSSDTSDQWTYGYDGLGRLKSATNSGNVAWNVTATYDAAGRLTGKTGSGGAYTYPAVNTAGMPDHAPSSVGSRNYTYDANGNRKSDGTTTFDYNAQNRLSASTKAGATTNYSYDAFGDRVKAGDTVTISLGGKQIMRVQGTSTIKYYYYYGSERVASKDAGGVVRYYVSDQLGSAHLILDNAGAVAKRMVYNPFGTLVQVSGTYADPFGLAGAETDASTGLNHLGARYYDPVIGQFTSADPSGAANPLRPQTLNRYTYVDNDPVNNVDPSGYTTRPVGDPYSASPIRLVYNPRQRTLGVEIDFTLRGKGLEFTYTHDFDKKDVDTMNLRFADPRPFVPDFSVNWRYSDDEIGLRFGASKAFGIPNYDGRQKAVSLAGGAGLSFNYNKNDGSLTVKGHLMVQTGGNVKYPSKIGRLQDTGNWELLKIGGSGSGSGSASGAGQNAGMITPEPVTPEPTTPADANAVILDLLPGIGPGMVNDLSINYRPPNLGTPMTSTFPGGSHVDRPVVDVPRYRLDLTPTL